MRKKFLAALLATSLVLTIAPVMPAGMAAVAVAEEKTEIDCNAFLGAVTDGQEVVLQLHLKVLHMQMLKITGIHQL